MDSEQLFELIYVDIRLLVSQQKRLYYHTAYLSTCNLLNMNRALMLCTNVMVCYNALKATKLQCFTFSYNEAYSLLTFGIELLNSSIESDAAMNGSLRTYVTLH